MTSPTPATAHPHSRPGRAGAYVINRTRARASPACSSAPSRLAVGVERARIARELHDVAAHSLSVMVVQAGAARSVLEADLDAATRALEAIATTGRQTIGDMGRLLGFLETDDTQSLGGISRIGDLVAQARQAGCPSR